VHDAGMHIIKASLRAGNSAWLRQQVHVRVEIRKAAFVIDDTGVALLPALVEQYFRTIDVIVKEIHTPLLGAQWDSRDMSKPL